MGEFGLLQTQKTDEHRRFDLGNAVFLARRNFLPRLGETHGRSPSNVSELRYLYLPNEIEASAKKASGGTAIVIQVPLKIPGCCQNYVVTAAHIVADDSVGEGPVVRINMDDGKAESIPTNHDSWFIEEKDDLAVIPMEFSGKGINVGVIGTNAFLTKELMKEHGTGPGNEVFVTGRFMPHEGKEKNTPSVRFGNISMMPEEPFKRPSPRPDLEEAFLVEFRSVGGYSGSPVFLCEPPFHLWDKARLLHKWSLSPRLLGVDLGHIHDYRPILRKTNQGIYELDSVKRYSEANTAMSTVVPAWRLMDLLNRADVASLRTIEEEKIMSK